MTRVSHGIDRIDVTFDDSNLVANAGLVTATKIRTSDDRDSRANHEGT